MSLNLRKEQVSSCFGGQYGGAPTALVATPFVPAFAAGRSASGALAYRWRVAWLAFAAVLRMCHSRSVVQIHA